MAFAEEKVEKDTKFWQAWYKQYSDTEMQKYLNDEGRSKFTELDKKYGKRCDESC